MAYRMLGSVMDAEDIVQEAFLIYNQLPRTEEIQNERAYLYKIVTNRCLDLLRSSERKRELYVGPWLPEPLIQNGGDRQDDPSDIYEQQESLSTAYLLLLQQLNAVERAVFLLREIFRYSYEEIAEMTGKDIANCRQIYHRAKKSFDFAPDEHPSVTVAEAQVKEFVNSLLQGNRNKLLELLSENVVLLNDGGGKVRAAQIPVAGLDLVITFLSNLLRMYDGKFTYSYLMVNGLPGIRTLIDDGQQKVQYIYSFHFHGDQIQAIYALANPDKLRHVSG